MTKFYLSLIFFYGTLALTYGQDRYWIATAAGNWSDENNWSTVSGGTGPATPPSTLESAIFNGVNGAHGDCILTSNVNIANITLQASYLGMVDLQQNTLTIAGTGIFSGGEILALLSGNIMLNNTVNVTFSGTLFNAPLTGTSARIFFNGSEFNRPVQVTKTGNNLDTSSGGNIFNAVTSITNSSSQFLVLAAFNPDIFNDALTVTNNGAGGIKLANNTADNEFNGNIVLNCTAGSGIYFSHDSQLANSTLAVGRTLQIGVNGFTSGNLRLMGFQQLGNTLQTLTLTNAASFRIGVNSVFNGPVIVDAPRIQLNGGTFHNSVQFIKRNSATDQNDGGNIFNGPASFINNSLGIWTFAGVKNDAYNSATTFYNAANGTISVSSPNNSIFNGNITVTCPNANGSILFGNNGGTSTLSDSYKILIGDDGYAGTLSLWHFVQQGNTPQTIDIDGTIRLGNFNNAATTIFNADLSVMAPNIRLEGAIFHGSLYAEKTGGTAEVNNQGNNTFNGITTLVNASTAVWRFGVTNPDIFTGDVNFIQASTGALQPGYTTGCIFQGDVYFESASTITVGEGNGVCSFTGNNNQTISASATTQRPIINRLVVNKPIGNLTLETNLSVGVYASFLSGIVATTGETALNFADNAMVQDVSNQSYVTGTVIKTGNDAFTFPIGADGFYRPIGISTPQNTTHAFSARYFHENQELGNDLITGLHSISNCEYWILNRVIGNSNVFVTLSWDENVCGVYDIADMNQLRVGSWDGSQWINAGNGGTTGSTSLGTIVTDNAQNTYAAFTLSTETDDNVLPVIWSYFVAQLTEHGHAKLTWATADEWNADYFSIERSENGDDFNSIGIMNSIGDSFDQRIYEFIDENYIKGEVYYRIKQVDTDGAYSYSKTIFFKSSNNVFFFYPNPVSELLYFLTIDNYFIYTRDNQLIKIVHQSNQVDLAELKSGVYLVRNTMGETKRLIVIK